MLDNPYNDSATSLANLVIKLTGADVSVVQKIKESVGEHGLLKYLSENIKDVVSRDDVSAMIAEALKSQDT